MDGMDKLPKYVTSDAEGGEIGRLKL